MKKKKIYIACGGSAGHIFPGLTFAEELARRCGDAVEISFFTSDNKIGRAILNESRFNFFTLPLRGFKIGSFAESLSFVSSLLRGSLKSAKIFFSKKPDCFVGFGSYIAGPMFVASSLLKIPTLIHEQNAVMGRANRLMRHFATRIALSFPIETLSKRENVVITGNPIRESVVKVVKKKDAKDILGLNHEKFTLLVMGGSQGSRAINSAIIDMLKNIEDEVLDRMQVIHISGEGDYERLRNAYQDIRTSHRLYPFFKEMGIIYSASDISISRAGSSCIFELSIHKIPSILIPYPFAEGHQVRNAKFLEEKGAAVVIEEKDLAAASLRSAVLKLMQDRNLRESMAEKIFSIAKPDAARELVDEAVSLIFNHATPTRRNVGFKQAI